MTPTDTLTDPLAQIPAGASAAADATARAEGLAALQAAFGPRLSRQAAVRAQHCHTVNWIPPEPPDAVICPRSTAEVARIVEICAAHRLPVIPFGAGSSLEGHVNAPRGGVCLSLREMDRILEISPADMSVVIQPGVTRSRLNEELRATGLFFPIDPGADATLGGMAATRASGTNAVRYGTMRDMVMGIEAVLPDGRVMRAGGAARKSSAGYDLTRLLVGSEGTLGILTELRLRLFGQPEAVAAGIAAFPDLESACNAVILTIQMGLPVARIELMDEMQIRACNAYSGLSLAERPTLVFEFHGSPAAVADEVAQFRALAEEMGATGVEHATDPDSRQRLWKARHDAHWANLALRPGARNMTTDVCVPISRLADCVARTQEDLRASGITATIVGHVGDGNFHVLPLFDPGDAAMLGRIKAFVHRLVDRAQAMGGTCTGEHGIGQEKRRYLEAETGAVALSAMAAIKRALDPHDIMNPGKILP
ncbi:FAD-binding oxidoreductase [Frigidibacter sp. MR17.24]|uniref:FAD-binding oxidoreductase n=1 Tax=Frigidibacter sp. MR17.24 TaxID=3127345 RepID=UPI003012AD28